MLRKRIGYELDIVYILASFVYYSARHGTRVPRPGRLAPGVPASPASRAANPYDLA